MDSADSAHLRQTINQIERQFEGPVLGLKLNLSVRSQCLDRSKACRSNSEMTYGTPSAGPINIGTRYCLTLQPGGLESGALSGAKVVCPLLGANMSLRRARTCPRGGP